MAMGAETDPCPHCPPVETHATAPCDEAINTVCAIDDQISAEPRGSQLKLKNTPTDLLAAIPPTPFESESFAITALCLPDTLEPLNPSGPPLNILYCVYLI